MALQCPARLLLVRHGEAAQDLPRTLTLAGRAKAGEVADRLRGERFSGLWTSTMPRAEQTAAILARGLRLVSRGDDRLREFLMAEEQMPTCPVSQDEVDHVFRHWMGGDLDLELYGESGREVVGRLESVLGEIADTTRGETSLVVSHAGILQVGLSRLCRNLTGGFVGAHPLPQGGVVELEIGDDGWWCRRWDGLELAG